MSTDQISWVASFGTVIAPSVPLVRLVADKCRFRRGSCLTLVAFCAERAVGARGEGRFRPFQTAFGLRGFVHPVWFTQFGGPSADGALFRRKSRLFWFGFVVEGVASVQAASARMARAQVAIADPGPPDPELPAPAVGAQLG